MIDELTAPSGGGTFAASRHYTWGLQLIAQTQLPVPGQSPAPPPITSFYGFDGHGSVRQLFDASGNVTDTYTYDAFGNTLSQTGSTPNVYQFAGEAFDSALGVYYNRARYLNTQTGRFWSMDTYEGESQRPKSFHKYVYVDGNPIDNVDLSGHATLEDVDIAMGVFATLAATSLIAMQPVMQSVARNLEETTAGAAGELYDEFSYAAGRAIADAELEIQTKYLTVATAVAMAQSIVMANTRVLTRKRPKVVPMPHSVIPFVADHVLSAWATGQPMELTRVSGAQAKLNRAAALKGVESAPLGWSWDEYPFASSEQGGAGASVVAVPSRENSIQGGIIIGSYATQFIAVGDDYTVVVIP